MIRKKAIGRHLLLAGALACSFGMTSAPSQTIIPDDYISGSWLLYRHDYVTPDGRVIDTKANGISHSEGQGYGMLIAVSADDQHAFDRIWAWTKANLYVRQDGLAVWRWDPAASPHATDANNATDGDLLIGWALARAAQKWKSPDYAQDAKRIADAIASKAVAETAYGKVLLPGSHGFSAEDQPDGPIVNLSYWVYPAIKELGDISASFPADELIRSGLSLTRDARFGPSQLPSDWISLKGKTPQPANSYPAQFGQDAIRVPLYLAWFSRDYPDILDLFANAWDENGEKGVAVIELATGTPIGPLPETGYHAIADLVACSLDRKKTADRVAAFQTTDYYPSTLHLLSLIALVERYPRCLPALQ